MATSVYFNNYGSHAEQRLIEDLIVESIKMMGFDCFYIPNDNEVARDLVYGEDPTKKFTTSYPLEAYLSNSLDYVGDKDFFSKFGLEIRDDVTVMISRRAFEQRVTNRLVRPREGDLIYVPFLNGTGEIFEITFVEQAKDFAMLGRKQPYFYELALEKFKYSNEVIATGMEDIDDVVTESSYTLTLNTGAGTGVYEIKELVFQSPDSTYANATTIATVQSWTPTINQLTVTNIAGEFTPGQNIIGVDSNASFALSSYNTMLEPAKREVYDNLILQTSANSIVDLSETNPFGSI